MAGSSENRDAVRDFLTSRRERLSPEQVGVPLFGGRRRVKGLRREEVAILAQVSTDYYTRLERGNLAGVSESVLDSLARGLQLDEAERTHLFDLARTANERAGSAARSRRTSAQRGLRPGVQRLLDAISTPAYVRNGRMDILGLNRMGRALFTNVLGADGGVLDAATQGFNLARFLFLDARSRDFYRDWETVARDTAASLRGEAGRNPYDRGLTDLVGELSTRSSEFRDWWAAHDVKLHRTATKTFLHGVVGELELTGEALQLPGDTGLTLIAYTVEPHSPSEEALRFLASWSGAQPAERSVARSAADED